MVKNIKGGNKTKKQRRGYQKNIILDQVVTGQMFGQVMENHGDHFSILCADNITRNGRVCSSAKKGPRFVINTFVVISVRDYETNQKNCDILGMGNPPVDIRNIFRKYNPTVGDDATIEFYTNNKFNTEEPEKTLQEDTTNNDKNKINNNDISDVFIDDGPEIYKDPKVHYDDIDWNDI
jgi:translation initiation factor IF-1